MARDILLRENFHRTVLQMIWLMMKGCFPWHAPCIRIQQDPSSLSCIKKAPHLDGAYAAFGKITEGMDVVNKIAAVRTDFSDRPLEEQKMKKVTVETFGETYPEPERA